MAVYTQISSDDFIITQENQSFSVWSDNNSILTPGSSGANMWFGGPNNQVNDYGSSATGRPGYTERDLGISEFYYTMYNGHYADLSSDEIGHIVYANRNGSGSYYCNSSELAQKSAISRMLYGQFRSLVYGDENRNFKFNGYEPEDILIIVLNRENYKQGLIPESLMLKLMDGSNNPTFLTTDALSNPKPPKITNIGRQYNMVSGSYGYMDGNKLNQSPNTNKGCYGLFYPDAGIMVFNTDALIDKTILSSTRFNNNYRIIDNNTMYYAANSPAIELRDAITGTSTPHFELQAEETLFSQNYLIRVPNEACNYTNNQTFVDEKGKLKNISFVDNPITYVTTVGLYNDQNELLAVAKLSKPLLKDFSKELFIKVKLDF